MTLERIYLIQVVPKTDATVSKYKFCERKFVLSVSLRSCCFSNVNLVYENRKFIIFYWTFKMYLGLRFCEVRLFVRELKVGILFDSNVFKFESVTARRDGTAKYCGPYLCPLEVCRTTTTSFLQNATHRC